ncbi:hypothetical protein NH44784_002651 [Achromobacter xylosoxidans NH44784-1996]|nr:hypothetical protein NH44784_002651 [Achromobacter xylosoxidans NH44784-1996]
MWRNSVFRPRQPTNERVFPGAGGTLGDNGPLLKIPGSACSRHARRPDW